MEAAQFPLLPVAFPAPFPGSLEKTACPNPVFPSGQRGRGRETIRMSCKASLGPAVRGREFPPSSAGGGCRPGVPGVNP